jgi:hypothetical protein
MNTSPADDTQKAVIDFLTRPETHGGAEVTRIDTHAATVFLAGERALKIKRAVRFPFLDFSTLEKRKAACQAELLVNRADAPAIYRRVLPITRAENGDLALGGDGVVVEWVVEMHRFDEKQTLDHVADAGRIDDALADSLGLAVAKAHAAAPVVMGFGFNGALATIVAQNDGELSAAPDLFAPEAVSHLTEETRAALARHARLIDARERAGMVRRCHGDLHLGNIVLIDGQPTLFDAIEFDERIATGDVFYDLAFLLMDLIERGLTRPANIVLNRYITENKRPEDFDALSLLPMFMAVRAAIRAKVTAARITQTDEREKLDDSARGYFALAGRLLAPARPRLIAIGGLSGTGKSLLARALAADIAPAPGAVVLRSDVERKLLFGAAETELLPQRAYTPEATEKVYASIAEKARSVIAAGYSAIVDAVFAQENERTAIAHAAEGVVFSGLFLIAGLDTRVERVGTRGKDASDADAAVARRQERYELGQIDWHALDASGTPADTLRRAQEALGI